MVATYRDRILQIAPPWLNGEVGSRILYSLGVHMDLLGDMAVDAAKMRFPGLYSGAASGTMGRFGGDVLPPLGRDRRIILGRSEFEADYATRLLRFRDANKHRGGPYELLRQIHAYYQGTVTVDLVYNSGKKFHLASDGTVTRGTQASWTPDSSTQWARWWAFYHWPTTTPSPHTWGDGEKWDDGSVWGSGFTAAEVDDIRTIPAAWNAAHAKGTVVVLGPTQAIGDYAWGAWPNQIGIV